MLFHSKIFLLFFAVVYPVYLKLSHRRQNLFLLAASYFFYGYWNWKMAALMLLTSAVDYGLALRIESSQSERQRKALLRVSICVNLLVLGAFKYFNFFTESFALLLQQFGVPASGPTLHILLPAGISFYTFQEMSYVIDVYRRNLKAEKSFVNFALFVSFFPQLIAGPIERAGHLLGQIQQPRRVNPDHLGSACLLFIQGYFQKTFLADGLNPVVSRVFDSHEPVSGIMILLGSVAYALEVYCDFAGYSNMARGLARLMGFELMKNFDLPYFSTHANQFWRRWHISLSAWFRDYLYIPLGGNKRGPLIGLRNVMIVMALSGLWHGAGWNFVLWGLYNGLITVVYSLAGRREPTRSEPGRRDILKYPKALLFFLLWSFGFVFFRSHSIGQIEAFLRTLLSPANFGRISEVPPLVPFVFFSTIFWIHETVCWGHQNRPLSFRWMSHPFWLAGLLAATAYLILFFGPQNEATFIYFQF